MKLHFYEVHVPLGEGAEWPTYHAEERDGPGCYINFPDGELIYRYNEFSNCIYVVVARNFHPRTLKAFQLRIYRVMDSFAILTLPEDRKTMTEAQALRSALRSAKQREQEGKRARVPLEYVPVRVIARDLETVKAIANEYGHDPSFIVRAAVHMFCEAYRRNPRALDL